MHRRAAATERRVRAGARGAAVAADHGPRGRPVAAAGRSRLVGAVRDAWSVAIKIGSKPHRFIRIWAVVVDGRIYARSWSLSPGGWYRTLFTEKHGVLQVAGKTAPFRAVRARGEALKAAIDRAYLKKYPRPSEAHYARDLCGPASRGSTVELRLDG
jgi:hypothetical protein